MQTNLAFCGLNCETCPIHQATLEPDHLQQHKLRKSIAELCNEHYGMNLKISDVTDCDGCRANGRLFSGCMNCEIRKCAGPKTIENCAYCPDYACKILGEHFMNDPDAKSRLEEIRKSTSC